MRAASSKRSLTARASLVGLQCYVDTDRVPNDGVSCYLPNDLTAALANLSTRQLFKPAATPGCDISPCFPNATDELGMMSETVLEPVFVGTEPD